MDITLRVALTAGLMVLTGCHAADPVGSAPVAPLPRVVDLGGPRMAHPQLVAIFFQDDPDLAELTRFTHWVVGSSWLRAAGAEYGIGAGSVLGVVTWPRPAPAATTDDALAELLFRGVADGTLPRPTTGDLGDVLYVVHLPAQTVVTTEHEISCVEFAGYHEAERRRGVELVYAVVPTCHGFFAGATDLEARELATSHEIIEAATDPFPAARPAFQVSDPTSPWLALGREVGDLCARGDLSTAWSEAGFVAQRSWSNVAAATGDPCVPVATDAPYFNTTMARRTLLRIPPGGRASIDLTGWATGAVADWALSAVATTAGGASFALGATRLGPGRHTTLEVAVPATTPAGTRLGVYVFSSATPERYQLAPVRAIVDAECATFTGCEACTGHDGCGYCATTARCEALAAEGSADSACPASELATWAGSCPGWCARYDDCGGCTAQPGCGWCGGEGSREGECVEARHDHRQPVVGACAQAAWSATPEYCEQ